VNGANRLLLRRVHQSSALRPKACGSAHQLQGTGALYSEDQFDRTRSALIKLDIINHVVNQTGLARVKAEVAVQSVFDSLKDALARGDRVELRGFGIFTVQRRKTGVGRNPRTREEVAIAPGHAVRFRPGKQLRHLDEV